MSSEDRIAIDELKKLGVKELLSIQSKQRAISLLFKDTTGEAEKRDKRINIAIAELNNENCK